MSKYVISLISLLAGFSSYAANMFTSTDLISGQNPFDSSQIWTASITSTLSDNYNGDYSKEEWRYTVTNVSYVPNPLPPTVGRLLGNGITIFSVPVCSFGLAPQPACSGAVLIDETQPGIGPFQDYFQPSGWNPVFFGQYIGEFESAIPLTWQNQGGLQPILVGQTAEFGFGITGPFRISTTQARLAAQAIGGSFAGTIDDFSGTIPFPVPTPEPTNLTLVVLVIVAPLAFLKKALSNRG